MAGRPRAATRRSTRRAAARRLEDRLVAGDEPGAWAIVEGRLGSGSNPDEILLDELGLAMRSVGEGWEAGHYTVDDEHRASGVATRVVARLGARFTKRGPRRRSVILGTPPHELHGLPTAMAANVLRGHGYDVIDLGADVPPDAFRAAVTKTARRWPSRWVSPPGTTTARSGRSCGPSTRPARACRSSSAAPACRRGACSPVWRGLERPRHASPGRGHRGPGTRLTLSSSWAGDGRASPCGPGPSSAAVRWILSSRGSGRPAGPEPVAHRRRGVP